MRNRGLFPSALLALVMFGCADPDELVLESFDGGIALSYTCSSIQPVAQGVAEEELLEELAVTAYQHAMGNGRSSEAAQLPSLRQEKNFIELEKVVAAYFCANRDALERPRARVVSRPPTLDSVAPSFSLPPLAAVQGEAVPDGTNRLSLASYRGKIIVLEPLATWCLPCRAEHRELVQLLPDLPEDVVVLGFVTNDSPAAASEWLSENGGTPFPMAFDPGDRVGNRYGLRSYPQLFVIDRMGRVAYHHHGEGGVAELPEVLAKL